mmetsp:Transcript_148350/g.476362  ORF Transcript_148350/g.476362 Transcript_148350/m.476362 type:complete len:172 (+) Transcript_148350:47-562(+)
MAALAASGAVDDQDPGPFQHVRSEYVIGADTSERNGLRISLCELVVDVRRPAIIPTGTGGHVWPSALALGRRLFEGHEDLLQGTRCILELGAGCGLPGLCAAALAGDEAQVVLTDYCPEVVERLEANVDLNKSRLRSHTKVMTLDWSEVIMGEHEAELDNVDLLLGFSDER